jgi:4-amino-4-deoxy-L-arabinose transferase-like glycosyltransferase
MKTPAAWLALLFLLLLTRLPALIHPRAIDDEQIYAVVGQEMLHGGLPYLNAVERKPPLLFAVYAAVLGTTGHRNWPALHFVAIAWTLATMAGLSLMVQARFDRETGLVAAGLYALYLMWGDNRNLAFNGEMLMNLPIVLAVLLTLAPGRGRRRPELLAAGMLIAIGALLKQPAGIAGLPLGLYVLSPGYRRTRGHTVCTSLWHGAQLALGFGGALAVAGVVLARIGILHETLYWSILAHLDPVGPSTWQYWKKAFPTTGFFVLETIPLWLGAAASFIPGPAEKSWGRYPTERWALGVLLAASLFGVSVNGQFLVHYYLQLLPPLAMLAAPGLALVLMEDSPDRIPLPKRATLIGWLAGTAVVFSAVAVVGLWHQRQDSAAGAWVRQHSGPTDRLYVWGQGDRKTGMYLDADRRPASRFIALFPLTGHVFGGYPREWGDAYEDRLVMPGAWDSLRADFAAHPPRFVIDAEATTPGTRYPVERYPYLDQLLAEKYREVAVAVDGIVYERVGR